MSNWFYGHTGFSFIDVWALVHFAFWVFAGSCVWALEKKIRWGYWRIVSFFGCLALAFGWEGLEQLLAPRYHQLWGDWFKYTGWSYTSGCETWTPDCHFESWWNSWISDPVTCVAGVLLIWFLLDNKK